ncbi:hypothetical protein KR222_005487 [Zaprionus bogoriensis]|nr:hypothetical protein KR222_005487 [Zaprionus bogoriensis]
MESANNNDRFNADELEPPQWLNAQFFTEVLRGYVKAPELKVVGVDISPASAKGDHYASVMFRGNVSYSTLQGDFSKSLIIKTMPEQEGHKKEMLGDSHIFETEIAMYTKALPKFEEILRVAGDNTKLCADCVYHSLEPRQLMIFEDLVPQGYVVIRDREATSEELKAAYTKLAKLHAVSFHLLNEKSELLQEFKHGLFDMPGLLEDPFMIGGMRLFIEFLDSEPELTKYKPFFKSIENDYMHRLKDIMQAYRSNPQPNNYYILCHGDFHLRNMMFKHDKDGSLEDCHLLDYQISNLCPISIDIIYSIYMFMGFEDRKNNYKKLVGFYFDVFVNTLKKIGFKGVLPNSSDFWSQLSNHKYYDLFLITTFLPLIWGVKNNSLEPAEILTNEESRRKLYYADNYRNDVKILLSRFEEAGYLQ